MLRALLRLLLALGGGAAATVIVAVLEARTVSAAAAAGAGANVPTVALVLALLGVLFPVAIGVAGAVGVASIVLDPGEPSGPLAVAASMRQGSVLERLRRAAIAPVLVLVVFGWLVASAYAARATLSAGTAPQAGLATGISSIGAFVAIAAVGLAAVPLVRRLLAIASEGIPQLLDAAITGGLAFALSLILMTIGVLSGDTGGGGGVLGIFGVLKRPELDLRPVANAFVIALGAYFAPVAVARRKIVDAQSKPRGEALLGSAAALVMALALLVLCGWSAKSIGASDEVRRGIEKDAPLGKIALAVLRKATDRDHDGYSALFGGGDCDDKNKAINPAALDVPGNGIDEDCTGADTPLVVDDGKPTHVTSADAGRKKLDRPLNIVLITVDTLRADGLGFAGYSKPTSPNLDALAAKSTVFQRAYSMASYTGKAVGPMLIGKYPSEANRNFSHFDTYYPPNKFVAERLHDAGIRTFAGMCHWYFRLSSGLAQGFDTWDTSAIPPGMGDNDTSITSDRESDLAIKMLGSPESTDGKRFFAWFHYFDPHAQYVPHDGAPDFADGEKSPGALVRAGYDGEVWFTDKHVGRLLDFIAQQPWAADTAIIVTADHGEAFGEHNMAWHGREIWEPLVRVPLIVYVPGAEPRRVEEKRSSIDLAPTILELAGQPLPEERGELQGTSLLEDVYAAKDAELEERDVLIDMPKGPFNDPRRAIITGKSPGTKLIHFGALYYNLFDLAEDPGEKNDLSKDKEQVKEVNARLALLRGRMKEFEVKEEEQPPKK